VAYPISCDGIDLASMLSDFGGVQAYLPCRCLGLPLRFRKPRRAELNCLLGMQSGDGGAGFARAEARRRDYSLGINCLAI
jgi:hypothetical protein